MKKKTKRILTGVLLALLVLITAAVLVLFRSLLPERGIPAGKRIAAFGRVCAGKLVENEKIPAAAREAEKPSYHMTPMKRDLFTRDITEVRSGPDETYEVITKLPKNARVHVTGRFENGWYQFYAAGAVLFSGCAPEDCFQAEEEKPSSGDWVEDLQVAQDHDQLIMVSGSGTHAEVSFHVKTDGLWECVFETTGNIGRNGLGKEREGDGKTPVGIFSITEAFGNRSDPGCILPYTHCDSNWYWVDDSDSRYYNKFVSTDDVDADWSSAEHINSIGSAYNYVLALSYNEDCIPGKGSAIFLHCTSGSSTAGCIAIQQEYMRTLMETVTEDCAVVIDTPDGILHS